VKQQVRPWSVWGLADSRLDFGTTVAIVVVLLWSRFGWLASGPWEWDETLFARGMLHFELAAHFPHPPGFPGWLAIGHVLLPLAGEPLRALQWASAAFSVVALWPLVILGRRVASPAVAAASALLVLFLPGPWFFAVRGFSSIAAATLALTAAAVWAGGLKGRRVTAFSLLITAAFLVRPILLPALLVLWLCGAVTVRARKALVPGILGGSAVIVAAVAVMVHLEGGWSDFLRSFAVHASSHAARLHLNGGGLADLGLVKGVGGLIVAAVLAGVAAWGLVMWGRRVGRGAVVSWILILSALIGPLLFLQNRTYARYAVPVQLAAAPLVAGALGALPVAPVAVFLVGIAAGSAWWSRPLLDEQHRTRLAAWDAIVDAEGTARRSGWAVVVDPEVHPFASYRWHVLEARGRVTPTLELSPRAPEGWAGVDRPWVVVAVHPELYLPSITARETAYGEVSPRLERMSQQRFLHALVIENPPLPVGQWWSRAELEDGTPFIWAGPEAELWLPPVPAGTLVGLDIRPAPGDAELLVSLNGEDEVRLAGRSDRRLVWFRCRPEHEDRPLILRLDRARGYAPGESDLRQLSAQVFSPVVRPLGLAYGGPVAASWDREALRLVIDGSYGPELFGKHGSGIWLKREAHLRIMIDEPGALTLSLRSPRPTNPHLVVDVEGAVSRSEVDFLKGSAEVVIELDPREVEDGVAEISLTSEPFVPSEAGRGSDTRELGVVLTAVRFRPFDPGPLCWWE